MGKKDNPVYHVAKVAIESGQPLQVKTIKEMRVKSKQSVMIYKSVFWIGIVVFNIALWVPLPFYAPKMLLYVVAFVSLAVAIVLPIFGLRKHQLSLELLKVNRQNPKKKGVDVQGRVYLDKIKTQDRPLINAEFELLEGSKWAASDAKD